MMLQGISAIIVDVEAANSPKQRNLCARSLRNLDMHLVREPDSFVFLTRRLDVLSTAVILKGDCLVLALHAIWKVAAHNHVFLRVCQESWIDTIFDHGSAADPKSFQTL